MGGKGPEKEGNGQTGTTGAAPGATPSPAPEASDSGKEAGAGQAAEAKVAQSDAIAKPLAETQETGGGDELPDNQYTRYYYDLKDRLEKNPNLRGPLTNMILSILLLAAKYGHYADMMPGRFVERLDNDDNLKNKKLNKDQADKVCAGVGKTDDEFTENEVWKKLDMDKASTKYACNVLWGIDDIENASSLAAYLRHTVKETEDGDVPIYEVSTLEDVKQQDNIARGTILIFIPDLQKGDKVVAFATGAKDEFKYYDANTDKVEIFHLRGDDSKVKSEMGLMVAMTPNTAVYFAAKEIPAEGEAPAAAQAETVSPLDEFKKTADAALTRLESDNQNIQGMLTDLELNPNPENVIYLLTSAEAVEADAQSTLADIQKQVDDFRIKLSAEDEKIADEYLARLKAIAEQAKINADHARDLESRI